MARRIIRETKGLPSFNELDADLTGAWDERLDRRAARAAARKIRLKLSTSTPDLVADYPVIAHAAEVLWDTDRIDQSRELVEAWRRRVREILDRRPFIDPFGPLFEAAVLSARLELRANAYEYSFAYALSARRMLMGAAGSREELLGMAGCPDESPLVGYLTANLAIGIPTGRKYCDRRPTLRAQYLEPMIDESLAILFASAIPPSYPRTHALAIQTFYAVAERGRPADEGLLSRLIHLDDLLRPRTSRGQATKQLRDVALSRWAGDAEAEQTITEAAGEILARAGLERHIEALTARGWWSRNLPSG